MLALQCPSCGEGDLFETPTWSFKRPFAMKAKCPKCGLNYEPEPGFYFGAMFVSYILLGWFCLFFVGGGMYFLGLGLNAAFLLLLLVGAIFYVYFFRVSRSIWLGLNTKYSTTADEND